MDLMDLEIQNVVDRDRAWIQLIQSKKMEFLNYFKIYIDGFSAFGDSECGE